MPAIAGPICISWSVASYSSSKDTLDFTAFNLSCAFWDSNATAGSPNCAIRVGQTVLLADNATGLITVKGLVQAVSTAAMSSLEASSY